METVTISESGLTIALAPDATLALAPAATLGTSLMVHKHTGGSGKRPSREERLAELAKDPDHGGKIDPKRRREAEVALDLEERGWLKPPVRRPARGDGHSGDFVDGRGQDWDVKQPHSRAQVEENIRQDLAAKGKPPPKFDPRRPIEGEFDLQETLKLIKRQFRDGKYVIIDTSKLNATDLAALRQALIEQGLLGTKVVMYP